MTRNTMAMASLALGAMESFESGDDKMGTHSHGWTSTLSDFERGQIAQGNRLAFKQFAASRSSRRGHLKRRAKHNR